MNLHTENGVLRPCQFAKGGLRLSALRVWMFQLCILNALSRRASLDGFDLFQFEVLSTVVQQLCVPEAEHMLVLKLCMYSKGVCCPS